MTLYICDSEGNGLVDQITKFHCWVFKIFKKDIFYVFCNIEELNIKHKVFFESLGCKFFPLQKYLNLLKSEKTTGIVAHNILGHDLESAKKLDDLKYDYCSIEGRNLFIADSLIMSRNLSPDRRLPKGCPTSIKNLMTGKSDRIGPHSLESWAYRTDTYKTKVFDWSNQPLHIYIDRCYKDTIINEATYIILLKEMDSVAIQNGSKIGDWKLSMKMAHKVYYLMQEQAKTGVKFDIKGAEKLLIRIDKEMKEIEETVEPSLGERVLPKGQQPKPPKNPWKKAFDYKEPFTTKGVLKKSVKKYLNLIGYTDEDNQMKYINSMINVKEIDGIKIAENHIESLIKKHKSLLSSSALTYCKKIGKEDKAFDEMMRLDKKGKKPIQLKQKLRLKHKKDLKEFLIKDGWIPTMWKARNIIIDKKTKQKLSKKEIDKKLDKYLSEFHNSVYWVFIYKELGYKKAPVDITIKSFRDKCIKNGRNLLSSPQYKDQRGVRCINLKKLTGETSKQIILWLSLQNRRNTIESPPSKTKKEYTGWLHNKRLKVDGRLPASSSGITNTYRQRHSIVVNVPKPKDHVVLGKEMRGLFIPRDNYYQIGCDACGLEARVMGHFTFPFDGGKFANEVLEGDIHTKNSEAFSKAVGQEIIRDDTKNLFYAIIYGTSAKKAAIMASANKNKGKILIDSFWESNPGLKKVKEAVLCYWESTNKKYIMGIDGRKVFVRSAHSAMNALFQSTGAIIMDFAGCWADIMIKKEGLDFYRTLYVHDEYGGEHFKNEVQRFSFKVKPEQERDGKLYSCPYEENGEWVQHYSKAGELIARGIEAAGKYYKMNLPFPGEYKVSSESWAKTH